MHIVKDNLCALKLDEHVRMMRMIEINKLDGHRYFLRSRSGNLWPDVDFRLGWVTSLQLNHLNTLM